MDRSEFMTIYNELNHFMMKFLGKPGLRMFALGYSMGVAAGAGRDKLTDEQIGRLNKLGLVEEQE